MKIGIVSGKIKGKNIEKVNEPKPEKELKLLDGKYDKIDFKKK